MSYNIRYATVNDGENQWENRKEQLINQLRFYEPDLLGLQEALPEQIDYLDQELPAYDYLGVGRDDGDRKGEFSAIFYKTRDLQLLKDSTFWLSPTPQKPSTGWDAAYPRVCTYGKFQRKSDGQQFLLFNTHFDHMGEKARVESMKLILTQIKKLNTENLPVILTGDLNVQPHESPIREMKTVLKDAREVAQVTFGPDATFNAFKFHETPQRRIDYIAVSPEIEVLKYAVLTDSYDQKYISDHFPVFVSMILAK